MLACHAGVDLGFTDNSIHGGYYADPTARKYRTNTLDARVPLVPKQIAGNISRHFRVSVPGAAQVYLLDGQTRRLATLQKGKGSEFTGFFKVPAGGSQINVTAQLPGATSLSLLLRYQVK